jgi:hypothetical protein
MNILTEAIIETDGNLDENQHHKFKKLDDSLAINY